MEEEGGGFNEGGMWRRREGGLMKVVCGGEGGGFNEGGMGSSTKGRITKGRMTKGRTIIR